ncbi:MAG TPA: hypothetical protein VKB27_06675 [Gammaproteobacteria bacterium]|nr:hypothetical protein [Gammaproteobacteria bacterium]
MSDDIQYPDHFIERLHTIWGEGFLSPGGEEEVGEIVRGLDLAGKVVLDVGFGTGGPAIALVKVIVQPGSSASTSKPSCVIGPARMPKRQG